MTIADSVWLATAMLHRENALAQDFSVREIIQKVSAAHLIDGFKPGLSVFTSKHCVANKPPNPLRHRILLETTRGRRRLFREGDPFHADRKDGRIRPEPGDLPEEYRSLVDWYDTIYAHASGAAPGANEPTDASRGIDAEPKTLPTDSSITALMGMLAKPLLPDSAGNIVVSRSLLSQFDMLADASFSIRREKDHLVLQPITEDFIRSLIGSCKGDTDLLETREREHRKER